MGQLERDAKKLGMELANDPAYGKAAGCFWGAALALGAVAAIGSQLAHVPGKAWIALAGGMIVLVGVIGLVIVFNRREAEREKRSRPSGTRIRPY
jgi:hypothetical protein